jgi:hydroxypyruvate isomerase
MKEQLSRRKILKQLGLGSLTFGAAGLLSSFTSKSTFMATSETDSYHFKGNINHSVCQWTYNFLPLEDLCKAVKAIGFNAIDLLAPKDWPMAQKYGIYSSMCYIDGEISLTKGFNDKTYHADLVKRYLDVIPLMVKAGYTDVICFSGNRNGMDDETGLKNCVEGLQQITSFAEKNGITLQMELLNSKINHHDCMCDNHKWGVELCKRVGSPNFKLLYDIYHMQIDEGDVIRTIRDNAQYFGHYHTGGVPGRNEIDETQELYYPAIMKAIVETGFKGYVAQEFLPTAPDKLASLKAAVQICDV